MELILFYLDFNMGYIILWRFISATFVPCVNHGQEGPRKEGEHVNVMQVMPL